jgi:archaellum biogenesis protein FlaJ (TadC family)
MFQCHKMSFFICLSTPFHCARHKDHGTLSNQGRYASLIFSPTNIIKIVLVVSLFKNHNVPHAMWAFVILTIMKTLCLLNYLSLIYFLFRLFHFGQIKLQRRTWRLRLTTRQSSPFYSTSSPMLIFFYALTTRFGLRSICVVFYFSIMVIVCCSSGGRCLCDDVQ